MHIQCPNCRNAIANPPEYAGMLVACPYCQAQIQLPRLATPVPVNSPPPLPARPAASEKPLDSFADIKSAVVEQFKGVFNPNITSSTTPADAGSKAQYAGRKKPSGYFVAGAVLFFVMGVVGLELAITGKEQKSVEYETGGVHFPKDMLGRTRLDRLEHDKTTIHYERKLSNDERSSNVFASVMCFLISIGLLSYYLMRRKAMSRLSSSNIRKPNSPDTGGGFVNDLATGANPPKHPTSPFDFS